MRLEAFGLRRNDHAIALRTTSVLFKPTLSHAEISCQTNTIFIPYRTPCPLCVLMLQVEYSLDPS
ncbi:hypothetical protein AO057_11005 [Curvibacter sp. PAE-UM]|nr:hypothetical protein AO057_11005 [Curvibacter sp. PAE-UM]